jgi:hypothetical protein
MELLALVQGLVLGIAADGPFMVKTDNASLLGRLTGTGRTASPLEAAARTLLAVAREAGLYQGLRHLQRGENKEAHRLANKARQALEKRGGGLVALLRLLPSLQHPGPPAP